MLYLCPAKMRKFTLNTFDLLTVYRRARISLQGIILKDIIIHDGIGFHGKKKKKKKTDRLDIRQNDKNVPFVTVVVR
jgi:hypothetical protein